MQPSAQSPSVTIISARRETVDALSAYLTSAGVASHPTQGLSDASLVSPATTAVVLFPDEFDATDVVARVLYLRRTRAPLLLVVVTGNPQRFRPALDADPDGVSPIVLPKPAFGWSILDALRPNGGAEA